MAKAKDYPRVLMISGLGFSVREKPTCSHGREADSILEGGHATELKPRL